MLFNSLIFIFLFLPCVLVLFLALARRDQRLAAGFLAISSLFFYGWWDSRYVLLLLSSVCANFVLSRAIWRHRSGASAARAFLITAIAANLALLGYYKYANFFVANWNAVSGSAWAIQVFALPLGISFFTFTQIAYQVDTYRRIAREPSFINYLLFVTYFPHLIAGPILHHAEMMPQFDSPRTYRFDPERFAIGTTLFILGLAKKTLCADWIAQVPERVFAAAAQQPVDLPHAWYGALGFAMQIYFDFSAYSDMALGISAMFGIRLPLNFDSPYKARNIIDFWRRWHMTLSRFLRDYLYFPLGGNRCSPLRRYGNLMITMTLGGLWHGAGWTFLIWGALHGLYLTINHGWRKLTGGAFQGPVSQLAGLGATFLAVTIGWVFFRADSLSTAIVMLKGMAGMNGMAAAAPPYVSHLQMVSLLVLLSLCWLLPNAYQLLGTSSPALQSPSGLQSWLRWRASIGWALGLGALAALSLSQIVSGPPSPFIYFQF